MITFNDITKHPNITLSEDKLSFVSSIGTYCIARTDIPIEGKKYFEMHTNGANSPTGFGVFVENSGYDWGSTAPSVSGLSIVFNTHGNLMHNGTIVKDVATFRKNEIAGIAIDTQKCILRIYKQGILVGTLDYSSDESKPTLYPGGLVYQKEWCYANFGQTPFYMEQNQPETWEALLREGYTPYDRGTERFLLLDGAIKTIGGGNLISIGQPPVVERHFLEHGFTNVQLIKDVSSGIGNLYSLLRYQTLVTEPGAVKISHLPVPQMVIPTTDINVSSYSSIKKIALATTGTTGIAKVIFSFDGGSTWQTYTGGAWQAIEPTADDVAANGISAAEVAAIPAAAWSVITGKLRVAYYLSKAAVTDDLAIASLAITGDTSSWKKAQRSVDYSCQLPNTNTMIIQLLKDGSYKINYMEAKQK